MRVGSASCQSYEHRYFFVEDYLIKVILNECDDPLMVTGELTEDEGFTMLIYQCLLH